MQQAEADGIRMLNEASPSKEVLTIRSLEAFRRAADGRATKLIIPTELAGVTGIASAIAETMKDSAPSN